MNLKNAKTTEERKEAAALLGRATSERKAAAARENGAKAQPGPGKPARSLAEYECTCGAGDSLDGHRYDCPRGIVIKRRRKAGTLP